MQKSSHRKYNILWFGQRNLPRKKERKKESHHNNCTKSQEEMRQQLRTITGWSPTICL